MPLVLLIPLAVLALTSTSAAWLCWTSPRLRPLALGVLTTAGLIFLPFALPVRESADGWGSFDWALQVMGFCFALALIHLVMWAVLVMCATGSERH